MPKRYKMMPRTKKKRSTVFKPIEPGFLFSPRVLEQIERGKKIHSATGTAAAITVGGFVVDREEQRRISREYPIAPAYNKGAYQVIPRDDINVIGRK